MFGEFPFSFFGREILLVYRKITVIVYTRGMAKLFSEKSMVIVKNMVVCSCGTQPYFLTLTLASPKKQLCVVLYRVH
jgi:hypothetical protein